MNKTFIIIIVLGIFTSICNAQMRVLPLEGGYNVRDLGGYQSRYGTVKWGKVYRSGSLDKLSPNDILFLEDANIKTVIDFRGLEEKKTALTKLPATVKNVINLGISTKNIIEFKKINTEKDADEAMKKLNIFLIENTKNEFKNFFRILSNEKNEPILFHCSAGKDRTGIAAALFLLALGVDKESVYKDYLLSSNFIEKKYKEWIKENPTSEFVTITKKEYLDVVFDVIDNKYGGIENYLTKELEVDLELLRKIYLQK